jgi:hypothetical protein
MTAHVKIFFLTDRSILSMFAYKIETSTQLLYGSV